MKAVVHVLSLLAACLVPSRSAHAQPAVEIRAVVSCPEAAQAESCAVTIAAAPCDELAVVNAGLVTASAAPAAEVPLRAVPGMRYLLVGFTRVIARSAGVFRAVIEPGRSLALLSVRT